MKLARRFARRSETLVESNEHASKSNGSRPDRASSARSNISICGNFFGSSESDRKSLLT